MDEHNQYVKNMTPKANFYMMELSEGWRPLCEILGVPIPEDPFPKANDAEAIEGLARQIFLEAGSRWLGILAAGAVMGYCLLWTWTTVSK